MASSNQTGTNQTLFGNGTVPTGEETKAPEPQYRDWEHKLRVENQHYVERLIKRKAYLKATEFCMKLNTFEDIDLPFLIKEIVK